MICKATVDGKTYKWIEKNGAACLVVDETRMLWRGDAHESIKPSDVIPLDALLALSILRGRMLTH